MSKFQAWFRERHPVTQWTIGLVAPFVVLLLFPLAAVWIIGMLGAEIIRGDI